MTVKVTETRLPGVLRVEAPQFEDERGFFMETYSRRAWEAAGFPAVVFVQDNLSLSAEGTLRGLHYQLAPHGMGKLVRAVQGSVFDVAVDLRMGSPAFGRWYGERLSRENGVALWIPAGFAHGFLALEEDSAVYYKCDGHYTPKAERTLYYADPEIGIRWPFLPDQISEKDAAAPILMDAAYNFTF